MDDAKWLNSMGHKGKTKRKNPRDHFDYRGDKCIRMNRDLTSPGATGVTHRRSDQDQTKPRATTKQISDQDQEQTNPGKIPRKYHYVIMVRIDLSLFSD